VGPVTRGSTDTKSGSTEPVCRGRSIGPGIVVCTISQRACLLARQQPTHPPTYLHATPCHEWGAGRGGGTQVWRGLFNCNCTEVPQAEWACSLPHLTQGAGSWPAFHGTDSAWPEVGRWVLLVHHAYCKPEREVLNSKACLFSHCWTLWEPLSQSTSSATASFWVAGTSQSGLGPWSPEL
jgi:hypothetical protein